MNETLVQSVMGRYKVSRQMAEELSRQIETRQTTQGLEGYYRDVGKSLGSQYASKRLVEQYYQETHPSQYRGKKRL